MSYPPPPPGPPYGTPPPAYFQPKPPVAPKATWSLVLGVISLCGCGILSGVAAIVLGLQGRKQVQESKGRYLGDGVAITGLVLGIIGSVAWVIVWVLITIFAVLGQRAASDFNDGCKEFYGDSSSDFCQDL